MKILLNLFSDLDILRLRSIDAAYSEFKEISRYFRSFLLNNILTLSAADEFDLVYKSFLFSLG